MLKRVGQTLHVVHASGAGARPAIIDDVPPIGRVGLQGSRAAFDMLAHDLRGRAGQLIELHREPCADITNIAGALGQVDRRRTRQRGILVAQVEIPLEQLERARRTPDIEHNIGALEALLGASASFPNGRVRGEAKLLVGLAFAINATHRARASAILEEVVNDVFAAPSTRKQALRSNAELLWEIDVREGIRTVSRHREIASLELIMDAAKRERRFWAHRIAIGFVFFFGGNALFAILRGAKGRRFIGATLRKRAVRSIAFGAFVGATGAIGVSFYERGHALPFLLLGGAISAIAVFADAWRIAGAGQKGERPRSVLRASLSIAATLSAAFLILESIDVRYLEAFGC